MKAKIHPKYYNKAVVTCACGNSFEVGSTEPKLDVEVCSGCHPFYTGKQKLVDVAGRIDKFKRRLAEAKKTGGGKTGKKMKKKAKKARKDATIKL